MSRGLGDVYKRQVVQLLAKEAKEKDKGIIMVTHDERLLKYCDRVVRIRDGELTE